jgi:hypothetical protein
MRIATREGGQGRWEPLEYIAFRRNAVLCVRMTTARLRQQQPWPSLVNESTLAEQAEKSAYWLDNSLLKAGHQSERLRNGSQKTGAEADVNL